MSMTLENFFRLPAGTDPFALADTLRSVFSRLRVRLDAQRILGLAVQGLDLNQVEGFEWDDYRSAPLHAATRREEHLAVSLPDVYGRLAQPQFLIMRDSETGLAYVKAFGVRARPYRTALRALTRDHGWVSLDVDTRSEEDENDLEDVIDRLLPDFAPWTQAGLTVSIDPHGSEHASVRAFLPDGEQALRAASVANKDRRILDLLARVMDCHPRGERVHALSQTDLWQSIAQRLPDYRPLQLRERVTLGPSINMSELRGLANHTSQEATT